MGAALRPTAPSAVVVSAPAPAPTPPPPPAAAPPAPAPATTVRVALDSAPQGATVTGAAGPLGKTPLLLTLPRSQDAVELTLTKPGYAPLPYKVIPYQDKELVASLKRTHARPSAAAVAGGPAPVKGPSGPSGPGAVVPARYSRARRWRACEGGGRPGARAREDACRSPAREGLAPALIFDERTKTE